MHKCRAKITVFFEAPFWVAVFERMENEEVCAAKLVLGSEPGTSELYQILMREWQHLKFSGGVAAESEAESAYNPKRRQREIGREIHGQGAGTKAQQAMKLEQARMAARRRQVSHTRTLEEKQRQFALRQQKKKQKHRGR